MTLLNVNIGVLGHVDSGKTSLAKALSTVASTASFDKNPQSKERGITLDLGFSSFYIEPIPSQFQNIKMEYTKMQYTLVDCPGHASLIRTIIGGAQIIDAMMLVVDITKGIQTQTAECLIIGEMTCDRLLIVLNKTDLIPESKRAQAIDKMKKRLWKTLEGSKFKDCPIVAVSANPGGGSECNNSGDSVARSEHATQPQGLQDLITSLLELTPTHEDRLKRQMQAPQGFLFAVDHCFAIRGQGTVLTGTVLNGSLAVGDTIEIPVLKVTKKVKSMQMFRQPVTRVSQGDRVGICVSQLEASQLERGLVCSPSSSSSHVTALLAGVCSVKRIRYFRGSLETKAKFHLTLGHETVLARVTLFAADTCSETEAAGDGFNLSREYRYVESLGADGEQESGVEERTQQTHYILFELEHPIYCPVNCLVIGSRLDTDIHSNTCRLAFHGRLLFAMDKADYRTTLLPSLRIFKWKSRSGQLERVSDSRTGIVRGLFKKETNLAAFTGLRVHLSTGQTGRVEGSFGQIGKCKIALDDDLPPEIIDRFGGGKKKKKEPDTNSKSTSNEDSSRQEPILVTLEFKRFVFDPKKAMVQS